jgi:cytolysin-activating lysine-acyltransferase
MLGHKAWTHAVDALLVLARTQVKTQVVTMCVHVSIDLPKVDGAGMQGEEAGAKTLGSMIGEIVWLMSQSPIHKYLSLVDLEWALMPPVILNQYKLFRDGKKPVGAALWGYLSAEAEEKLKTVGRLAPQDWGNNARLDADEGLVPTPGGTLWLVELIAPFHNEANKHREQMLADLVQTILKGKPFRMMHVSPESGHREELIIGKE